MGETAAGRLRVTNSIDVSIRVESAAGWPAIRDANGRAFGRDNEARLVEAVRGTTNFAPALSLVAVDDGRVVGHILFSRIRICTPEGAAPALALAPLAADSPHKRGNWHNHVVSDGARCHRRCPEIADGPSYGDNWTVGWQGQDALWQGNATEFAPNGKPLSPNTTGFTGRGMQGGTLGLAIDAKDNAWFSNYGGKSIAEFDKNGKALTPPEGITFNGRLGLMEGIIVTPGGDVWILGIEKDQLVYFPKGDLSKGRIVCEGDKEEPCKSFRAPFHLGIDQQDRIWVSNSGVEHVTRFPATDPSMAENFKSGFNSSGLGIDSLGNVWVTNRFGNGLLGMAHLIDMGVRLKLEGVTAAADYLTKTMSEQKGGSHGGSVVLLRPDGTPYSGSPFTGGGLPGPWAVAVDGNDNIWISTSPCRIVQSCSCAAPALRTVRPA